jgi:serine/threonine protein kinase
MNSNNSRRQSTAGDGASDRQDKAATVSPSAAARNVPLTPTVPASAAAAALPLDSEWPSVPGYQIIGELGQGGMGAVLRGRDPILERELAVKILLERFAGDVGLVRRFVAEAQLTGQLEHPCIVPVHQLATLPNGLPYFTMKLVQGRTLAALLQERPSPQHELPRFLKVFEQVCQAVAFAHAQHVIHRDLKPLNIMVGAFGELQVMDWGLAKIIGIRDQGRVDGHDSSGSESEISAAASEESQTQAGAVLGTPSYMPPEQARGARAEIDERADVFALGAVLCEILTGRPPYVASSGADVVLQAIDAHLIPAFERLNQCGADAELVNLAKLCLTPDRDQRPRHAGAVSEAVTAYLAGVQEKLRAVEIERAAAEARAAEEARTRVEAQARAEAERQAREQADRANTAAQSKLRAERRVRRLSVAITITLIVGVLAAGYFAVEADREAAGAKSARKQMNIERDAAQRHFGLARDAVEKYFVSVSEDPRLQELGLESLRKDLLASARDYYERFVRDQQQNPELRADLAKAYVRLAEITEQIGARADALALYQRAIDILAHLASIQPHVSEHRHHLILAQNAIGDTYRVLGNAAEAEASFRRALALLEDLPPGASLTGEDTTSLAVVLHNLGLVHSAAGRHAEAIAVLQRSIALTEGLTSELSARQHETLADSLNQLGIEYQRMSRWSDAETALRKSVDQMELVVKANPHAAVYRHHLAAILNNTAAFYLPIRELDKAQSAYERALALWEPLARTHPEITDYREFLAACHYGLGVVALYQHRSADAEMSFQRTLEMKAQLIREHPGVPRYRTSAAHTHYGLGNLYQNTNQAGRAEEQYRNAIKLHQQLLEEQPNSPEELRGLAMTEDSLGNVLANIHRPMEAETALRQAIAHWERLIQNQPSVGDYRSGLGGAYGNLGNLARDTGQTKAAMDWFAKSIEILQPLVRQEPRLAEARRFLRNGHVNRAAVHLQIQNYAEALKDFDEALAIDDSLASDSALRVRRGLALAGAGHHVQAAKAAEDLAALPDPRGENAYNLACLYALASSAAKSDITLAEGYAARAVAMLQRSRAAGMFKDPAALEQLPRDPDLAALRGREDFQKLLRELLPPNRKDDKR